MSRNVMHLIMLQQCSSQYEYPHAFDFLTLQEIKFEPNVMCEHIDKKLTFRSSQVCQNKSPFLIQIFI
jgi:hypothetical protein